MKNPNRKPKPPRKTWVTFSRRTDYPKLGYLIHRFRNAGIACRFAATPSFHAPILQVLTTDLDLADQILVERYGVAGKMSLLTLDDLPDNHISFAPFAHLTPSFPQQKAGHA